MQSTTETFFNGHFIEIDLYGYRFRVIININTLSNKHLSDALRHNHAFFEVFLMILNKGELKIDNDSVQISKNMMVLIGPKQYHNVIYENADENSAYSFRFSFEPILEEMPDRELVEFDQVFSLLQRLSLISCEDSFDCFSTMEKIKYELRQRQMGCNNAIKSLLELLIIGCLRTVSANILASEKEGVKYIKKEQIKSTDTDLRMKDLIKIEKYFAENMQDNKLLDSLAEHIHLSRRQAERLIKSYFGITYREKLIMTRIEMAKELLAAGSLSVEEIAYQVGYSSRASFSASFKNYVGQTPVDYKNKK